MQETTLPMGNADAADKIEQVLANIARNILVIVFGLLPLFFIPVPYIGFDYAKAVFVMVGLLAAIVFFSLSVLRSGKVTFSAPLALGGLWFVALAALVSALLSGSMHRSLIGDDINVETALFILLLALIPTVTTLIGQTKASIMRLFILLTGSGVVLGLFHIVRILFGANVLSFKVFTSLVASPIGGWNDIALFFGLSILISLVALEQLPLTKWGKTLFSLMVALALIMLTVVNFFAVWVVLGLVSLMVLMYTLTKDRFMEKTLTFDGKRASVSLQSVIISVIVFAISLIFVIGGGAAGAFISKYSHISYVEVRPSFSATMQIARDVYSHNALLGIGPNKFLNAWRLYKDPSINQTIFWATDFNGGSGYVTTLFVTTGILGIIALLAFFGLFLYAGFRMLFRPAHADRFWYFIGSSSFVAAAYLWGMSFIYVPGASILLLASVLTGMTFAAYAALLNAPGFAFSLNANKRVAFALVGIVMVVIVAATTGLYYLGQHYSSVYSFGNAVYALQNGADVHSAEQQIANAYATSHNETYAMQLASYQLAKINSLAGVDKLDQQQQQELQSSIQNGVNAAQVAINQDGSDPLAWTTLGSIYSILAAAKVDNAQKSALDAFEKAHALDPKNPVYSLLEAQLYSRVGDLQNARAKANEAITMKPNYTDALFFLAQLDIAEGKTADAIATTQTMISIEPSNPARYYQLGFLEFSDNKLDDAIATFKQALALDSNYANARYFLGLALAEKGDTQGAIDAMQEVLKLNPGNTEVSGIIDQLKSGKPLQLSQNPQVNEPEKVQQVNDTVTTSQAPDTSLVSPVNPVAEDTHASKTEKTASSSKTNQ